MSLRQAWRAAESMPTPTQVLFVRVRLIAAAINLTALVLLPSIFLTALFLHIEGAGLAAVLLSICAVAAANEAILQAFRVRLAFSLGFWTDWSRTPIRRAEQPNRFYRWTAYYAVISTTYGAAVVFCVWVAIQGLLSHPH
jgi:hypothetical protein